jgi:hypothetical protein
MIYLFYQKKMFEREIKQLILVTRSFVILAILQSSKYFPILLLKNEPNQKLK